EQREGRLGCSSAQAQEAMVAHFLCKAAMASFLVVALRRAGGGKRKNPVHSRLPSSALHGGATWRADAGTPGPRWRESSAPVCHRRERLRSSSRLPAW